MKRYREENNTDVYSVRLAVERKNGRSATLLLVSIKSLVGRRGNAVGGGLKRLGGFQWRLSSTPYHVGIRRASPRLALKDWLNGFSNKLSEASARELAAWKPGQSSLTSNIATLKRQRARERQEREQSQEHENQQR